MKKSTRRKFLREKCQNLVRDTFVDRIGRRLTLVGKHSYEWSIIIDGKQGISMFTYANRSSAMEDWQRYKSWEKNDKIRRK